MRRVSLILIFYLISFTISAQMRNGWRPIYDKEGRLTRMMYYQRGLLQKDSTQFYQYYTDNVLKGKIVGEIESGVGCTDGSVYLYDYSGNLTNYSIKSDRNVVFNVTCDYNNNCVSTWVDPFETNTGYWLGDSIDVRNGNLNIYNRKSFGLALYNPIEPIDIHNNFICVVQIPTAGNNLKQGVVLGWKDMENYFLIEISHGEYFSILSYEDGVYKQISEERQKIEKHGEGFNEIKITNNGKNFILELNGSIEMVLPIPDFIGDQIGLVTRSRGKARFGGVFFQYPLEANDDFYKDKWIGKGSGFFITKDGKIITTYDAIMDAKRIRVKTRINGEERIFPVKIIGEEIESNLAILKVDDSNFSPFLDLPYGFLSTSPASNSKVFSIGYPNSISGIIMDPQLFEGSVLSGANELVMDFRYGMIGAPVFDYNANLIGIVDRKGLDLRITEIVDFDKNARLLKVYMGVFEKSRTSPFIDLSKDELKKKLSDCIVIVESSLF